MDDRAHHRFGAYVRQARQYYAALGPLDPVAKPLIAYYFGLNLAKAFLTAVEPTSTAIKLTHGLGESFTPKQRYFFQQEQLRIQATGVFRLLAERTGQQFCYATGHLLRVVDLLPYLPEAYDLYADVADESPKLLPIEEAYVLFGGKEGWLRVEVDRDILRQRNIGPESLLNRAAIFGSTFKLVASQLPTASYECTSRFAYGKKRSEILQQLCSSYERSLIACQRYVSGGRRFVVISTRTQLLSHEAVSFAVLHHLSTMVRYRPQNVEQLRGKRYYWVFASWVDRACENLLLALSSRITREEHVVT